MKIEYIEYHIYSTTIKAHFILYNANKSSSLSKMKLRRNSQIYKENILFSLPNKVGNILP